MILLSLIAFAAGLIFIVLRKSDVFRIYIYSKTLFPFFDGLIPEGWLLGAVSRNWKIDITDRFGLLLVACKDGIGNVSIREERV